MANVLIIGAGIGWLCTAVRLLKKGFNVTIIEKEFNLGGKINLDGNEDFRFDLTASIMMTPDIYLDEPMINIRELFKLSKLKEIVSLQINKNCYDYISKFIDNEKFKEYLLFQAMYMGINPYENSAIYSIIPEISHGFGISYIKGGMYKYILELEKYIGLLGGKIKKGNNVEKIIIKNNKVIGVKTAQGIYKSDIVVCNADFPYAMENLFEESIEEGSYSSKSIKNKRNSYAVFIIYLGLSKKYSNLTVHNIYINKNLRESLNDTEGGRLPMSPSIYIYYPSDVDESFCTEGKSVMNIMVRVPNLQNTNLKWDRDMILDFRNIVMETVKKIKGLEDIEEFIEYESFLTPVQLQSRFKSLLIC